MKEKKGEQLMTQIIKQSVKHVVGSVTEWASTAANKTGTLTLISLMILLLTEVLRQQCQACSEEYLSRTARSILTMGREEG